VLLEKPADLILGVHAKRREVMPTTRTEEVHIVTKEQAIEFIEIHLEFGADVIKVTKAGEAYHGKADYIHSAK
jgi:hypothetical protein